MGKINCCRGCVPPKRQIGCHSTCPDYIKESEENDKRKAALIDYRSKEEIYMAHRVSVLRKERKRG